MSSLDLRNDAPNPGPAAGEPTDPADRWARWRRYTRPVLIANLIGQAGIIVTGGAVRLTGSGLGCDTWPMCEPGSFTPRFHQATTIHPYIEFGNRTLTGVLLALAIAVLVLVGTDRSRSPGYRRLGAIPLLGVLVQAVVGGVVVLLGLAPGWVGVHYLVSAALVAASTLVLYRQGEGDGPARAVVPGTATVLGRALMVALVPVVALGVLVTGSGPHGGDENVAARFPFDPVVVTGAHAGSVWVFVGVLVALVVVLVRGARAGTPIPLPIRRALSVLGAVVAAQAAIGYGQFFAGLPAALVALHMAGSALLVAATTWAVLTLRVRDVAVLPQETGRR